MHFHVVRNGEPHGTYRDGIAATLAATFAGLGCYAERCECASGERQIAPKTKDEIAAPQTEPAS